MTTSALWVFTHIAAFLVLTPGLVCSRAKDLASLDAPTYS